MSEKDEKKQRVIEWDRDTRMKKNMNEEREIERERKRKREAKILRLS